MKFRIIDFNYIYSTIFISIFLSFHYNPIIEFSFLSINNINREVNNGWIIRIIHINGASIFFLLIFTHIVKNIINSSWKLFIVWNSGVVILLLSIIVAFIGYVLPWGQISFWAATVITNLLSAIPYLGKFLVTWIWGGFSVSYATLRRFFSFHFLLPFLILLIIILHILFLHINGSSNTISSPLNLDKIRFDPFFSIKDILGFFFFFFFIYKFNIIKSLLLSRFRKFYWSKSNSYSYSY